VIRAIFRTCIQNDEFVGFEPSFGFLKLRRNSDFKVLQNLSSDTEEIVEVQARKIDKTAKIKLFLVAIIKKI